MKALIKQLLRENLERRKDYPSYIRDAVRFGRNYLGIKGKVLIKLTNDKSKVSTTAYFSLNPKYIMVYIKERSLVDVLRSIFHEMEHMRQDENGELNNPTEQGKTASIIENTANAKAGELIRHFGKLYPIIYEL